MEFGNFGQRLIRVDQRVEKVTEPGPMRCSVTADDCGSPSIIGLTGVLPAGLSGVTKLVIPADSPQLRCRRPRRLGIHLGGSRAASSGLPPSPCG